METAVKSKAIRRALTTVNAPLPIHIDAGTLLACLLLNRTDGQWSPHVRAFFSEFGVEVMMDMVVEGSITFNNLSKAIRFWNVEEDTENARWIWEMASVSMAKSNGSHLESHRFSND